MKSCRTCVHWQHAIDFPKNSNLNHVHTYVVGAYYDPGIGFICARDQSTHSQMADMRAMVKQMLADQGYTNQQSDRVEEEHEEAADAEYEAAYNEAWVVAENAVLHNHGRNCSSYELCPECLLLTKVGQ